MTHAEDDGSPQPHAAPELLLPRSGRSDKEDRADAEDGELGGQSDRVDAECNMLDEMTRKGYHPDATMFSYGETSRINVHTNELCNFLSSSRCNLFDICGSWGKKKVWATGRPAHAPDSLSHIPAKTVELARLRGHCPVVVQICFPTPPL